MRERLREAEVQDLSSQVIVVFVVFARTPEFGTNVGVRGLSEEDLSS